MPLSHAQIGSLLAIEQDVFEALLEAYRDDDIDAAEKLFKIWLKLPNQRPWPIGKWPICAF